MPEFDSRRLHTPVGNSYETDLLTDADAVPKTLVQGVIDRAPELLEVRFAVHRYLPWKALRCSMHEHAQQRT